MKRLTALLIISFVFTESISMQSTGLDIHDKGYLQKIDFATEQIQYHIIQKNISIIIRLLESIQKIGRNLKLEYKKRVDANLSSLIVGLIWISDKIKEELNNGYSCDVSSSSLIRTRSISPRTEDNPSSLSGIDEESEGVPTECFEIDLLEKERESEAINQRDTLNFVSAEKKFQFLDDLINTLKQLKMKISRIEGN